MEVENTDRVTDRQINSELEIEDVEDVNKDNEDIEEIEEPNLENLEVEGKNFRFFNQKVLLTYSTHIDRYAYVDWLNNTRKWPVKKIYIAHENGDKTNPYPHTHIIIDFGKARDSKSPRCLDYNGIHPNIKKILSHHQWRCACNYLTKEDKEVELDKEDKMHMVDVVWKCKTYSEVLEKVPMNLAMQAEKAFKNKPRYVEPPDLSEDMFYPWQKKMKDIIFSRPTSRQVYWIYDDKGDNGKNAFCEWASKMHSDKTIYMTDIGAIRDFSKNLQNFYEKSWSGDTLLINLTREFEERKHIYRACEMALDKYVTCTKYEGGGFWLNKMHVIVYANFPPMVDKMSKDRWVIYEIDKSSRDMEHKHWSVYKDAHKNVITNANSNLHSSLNGNLA